jgi:hypothetical protein
MGPDGRARLFYGQGDVSGGGVAARAGVLDANRNGGSASLLYGNLGLGRFTDSNGRETRGVDVSGGVARVGLAPGGDRAWGADAGVGTFAATSTINDSTASLGVQANAVELNGHLAGQLWGDRHAVHLGASLGAGAGGRLHYGDEDGNGVPEMGFGFDAGPVSFDVRSETIGRGYQWLRRQLGYGGPQR